MFVVDGFSETGLNLFRYIKIVEDRNAASVEFHYVGFLWGDEFYIVFYFMEHVFVVDIDVLVGGVEQIPKQGYGTSCFFENELWAFLGLLHSYESVFPTLGEYFEFCVQFGNTFALSNSAYYYATVFRLDTVDELLESCALFTAFNFG